MPQSEVELQPPVREIRVPASDNVSLYVRVAGPAKSGPVLITIHGGPGMSSRYMLSLEQLAGPDLTVVSWDQRGANLSTSPPDESSCYSLPKYAKDLEAVRLAVGAETVHLLGHSWGGIVALQYAILYPDNVQMRIHALQQDGIMTTETPQSAAEALIAVLPAYFFDPSFQLPPNDLAGVINLSLAANQLTYEQLEDFDLTPDLAGLTMQVLILHGADDPFGGAMIDATREALANAEVKVIGLPDCGHFWQECPDDFYCAVRGFLSLSE
jgi:proline iminopeptidase